jgi:Phage tail protein
VITWVDSQGNEFPLTETNGVQVYLDREGFFMPPVEYNDEAAPLRQGSFMTSIRFAPRMVNLKLHFTDVNEVALRQKIRSYMRAFNPLDADGRIRVLAPDGREVELFCRYVGQFEGKETPSTTGQTWFAAVAEFRSFDPFFFDRSPTTLNFTTTATPGTFLNDQFLPLNIVGETVFSEFSIDNDGDVECFPEITIVGPGNNPIITNKTTGKKIALTYSVPSGNSIIIDTYKRTVVDNYGTNLYSTLSTDSSLWTLARGMNSIRVEMGTTDENSSITFSYKRRYLGV